MKPGKHRELSQMERFAATGSFFAFRIEAGQSVKQLAKEFNLHPSTITSYVDAYAASVRQFWPLAYNPSTLKLLRGLT